MESDINVDGGDAIRRSPWRRVLFGHEFRQDRLRCVSANHASCRKSSGSSEALYLT